VCLKTEDITSMTRMRAVEGPLQHSSTGAPRTKQMGRKRAIGQAVYTAVSAGVYTQPTESSECLSESTRYHLEPSHGIN